MTRILLLTPRYPPYRGGALTYFSNLVDSLSTEHEFFVLTSYHPNAPIIENQDDSSTIYRVIPHWQNTPKVVRLLIGSITTFIAATILKVYKNFDGIHAHSTSFAVPGIAMFSVFTRCPIIYDCRDEDFPSRIIRLGNTVAWFSCASNIDSKLIEAGVPKEAIIRIPVINPDYVGRYTNEITPRDENDPFQIIYIGSLRELKGVPHLIRAFRIFSSKHTNSQLTLVGEGPLQETLKQTTKELGIEDKVEFTGALPHKDALKKLSNSDVLVLPSRSEGVPRVITEAFELGVPVVATPVGGIPDLLENGKTGLLIERTPESIAEALEEIYNDPQLRIKIIKRARDRTEDWNWSTISSRITEFYGYF